jgi:hypothetical protein
LNVLIVLVVKIPTINGGQLPYTIETTGPDNYSTSVVNLKLLVNGSYVTTITDSLNNSVQYTNTITSIGTEITLNWHTTKCQETM